MRLSIACEPRARSVNRDEERVKMLSRNSEGSETGEEMEMEMDAHSASRGDKKLGLVERVLGVSSETIPKLITLSALFALDNLASGLVPL
jgi:hypothetical protein